MTKPLFPAAQAILRRFWDAPVSPARNVQIAAALRAAADQVVPVDRGSRRQCNIRARLLAIAAELEGLSND
jgi:hypothetical protein